MGKEFFYYICNIISIKAHNLRNHINQENMKQATIISILSMLLAVFTACEKPVYDEEEDKEKTENKSDGASHDKNDNGGWINGEGNKGNDWQDGDTISVSQFMETGNDKIVLVRGYIVGSATGAKGYDYNFTKPFKYETALLLADKLGEDDKAKVISIQLKSGSAMREELNLAQNPENYRKLLTVYGMKTTYLKIPGIKEIYFYDIEE